MSLIAKNLSVAYSTGTGRDLVALEDINFEIARGEFVTIIGPSGCGKSTLLHCLGGMLKPSSGVVTLDEEPIRGPDARRAAFVFQDYTLLPWRQVLQNAVLGLRFDGVPKAKANAKGEEMLALVGLTDFRDAYPRELSGGMQQRVAIARAMCMEPGILLMDEPFGALDEQTRRQLGFEMARMLSERDSTVVMVTHSLDEAIMWADRIIVMSARPGRIAKEIRVTAPRPRTHDYIATEEFASLRSELFILLDQSNLSDAGSVGQ
jgi:NitT/TauT family transport system ATP-binding protein